MLIDRLQGRGTFQDKKAGTWLLRRCCFEYLLAKGFEGEDQRADYEVCDFGICSVESFTTGGEVR